ncbi:MAG: hypothetical protein V7K53_03770 [Nostoc sp.]
MRWHIASINDLPIQKSDSPFAQACRRH